MSLDQEADFLCYDELLAPVFSLNEVDIFEYAYVLLRIEGMQAPGWGSLQESHEVRKDLIRITHFGLLSGGFKNIEKTH